MNSWASPRPGPGCASSSSTVHASPESISPPGPAVELTPEQQERLIGLLSHELRTPLTVILGVLSLLQSGQLSPSSDQGQELLELAVKNIHRMTQLAQLIESHSSLSTILLMASDLPSLAPLPDGQG